MREAFYCKSIPEFLSDLSSTIRDSLTQGVSEGFYQQLSTQTSSWSNFIDILKESFTSLPEAKSWGILLEYSIPRRSKRIDAVLVANDIVFVIEYKDGESNYLNAYQTQVEDYCLDLRDFHFESKDRIIIPVLLCQRGKHKDIHPKSNSDYVQETLFSNADNFKDKILKAFHYYSNNGSRIDYNQWNKSKYFPTPTIIEAAQALYSGQQVEEISRSHAGAKNLTDTTTAVLNAIKEAKASNSKIICFITGVPGAGKTLAGLNIVHNRDFNEGGSELGVFLSGNSPLVKVLTEALSRDTSKREKISKDEANRRVSTFIHNVHQFIDEYYEDEHSLPVDRVLIYDEAQRAWTKEYKYKKSQKKINASEPDILLSIMDRFKDSWAVIIALVGGGQEINTGEGGLPEWGKSIVESFSHWKVYVSPELKIASSKEGEMTLFKEVPVNIQIIENSDLHLKVALRSYKAQELSEWVNLTLSNNSALAKGLFKSHLHHFPILITRSLDAAKEFLKKKSRGSRRSGLVASSGGRRLRAEGIDVNSGLKGTSDQNELGCWYLNPADDVRSSNFLEVVGSEFGVQGLELDWTCVCWDADLRRQGNNWAYKSFKGTSWFNVNDEQQKNFITNKYRVLLTRAREGMVIFIPKGDTSDETRLPEFYDHTFEYLKSCGAKEIY